MGILLINCTHECSHVTENKRSHNGTDQHNYRTVNRLEWSSRSRLVTDDQENSIVEALEVLLNSRILKEVRLLSIQVFWWQPFL